MDNREINNIRNAERKAIYQSCQTYPEFTNLNVCIKKGLVYIIESSILDAAVDKSTERNLPVYWSSESFVCQYSNIGYQIKSNIDILSNVNLDLDPKIATYLASNLCDYGLFTYAQKFSTFFQGLPEAALALMLSYICVFNFKKIGYMNSLELNPYINQKYLDELALREQQSIVVKFTKMYTCPQCGDKKANVKEKQTRSADEGGTLFITCINCKHVWLNY